MDKLTESLYVGDMSDMSPISDTPLEPEEFDNVVTLGRGETPHTTEQYEVENSTNSNEEFFAAVDSVRQYVDKEGELTFVHCTAGVSRGATVAAAAYAAERDISMDEAFEAVKETREQAAPHPDLFDLAEEYLSEHVDSGGGSAGGDGEDEEETDFSYETDFDFGEEEETDEDDAETGVSEEEGETALDADDQGEETDEAEPDAVVADGPGTDTADDEEDTEEPFESIDESGEVEATDAGEQEEVDEEPSAEDVTASDPVSASDSDAGLDETVEQESATASTDDDSASASSSPSILERIFSLFR